MIVIVKAIAISNGSSNSHSHSYSYRLDWTRLDYKLPRPVLRHPVQVAAIEESRCDMGA